MVVALRAVPAGLGLPVGARLLRRNHIIVELSVAIAGCVGPLEDVTQAVVRSRAFLGEVPSGSHKSNLSISWRAMVKSSVNKLCSVRRMMAMLPSLDECFGSECGHRILDAFSMCSGEKPEYWTVRSTYSTNSRSYPRFRRSLTARPSRVRSSRSLSPTRRGRGSSDAASQSSMNSRQRSSSRSTAACSLIGPPTPGRRARRSRSGFRRPSADLLTVARPLTLD